MSDSLQEAARALRQVHGGERLASGATRARVLASLGARRRRNWLGWLLLGPVVALGLGGTAWAQATGRLEGAWAAVQRIVVGSRLSQPEPRRPAASREAKAPPSGAAPAEAPSPLVAGPASPAEEFTMAEGAALEQEAASRSDNGGSEPPAAAPKRAASMPAAGASGLRRNRRRRPPAEPPPAAVAKTSRSAASSVEAAPDWEEKPNLGHLPPVDRELLSFRRAHDLHFRGDNARGAIRAYEEYLERYPHGRFEPEARYNVAINRLKMGDKAGAARGLLPFAEGHFGELRRKQAQALLRAISSKSGSPKAGGAEEANSIEH